MEVDIKCVLEKATGLLSSGLLFRQGWAGDQALSKESSAPPGTDDKISNNSLQSEKSSGQPDLSRDFSDVGSLRHRLLFQQTSGTRLQVGNASLQTRRETASDIQGDVLYETRGNE